MGPDASIFFALDPGIHKSVAGEERHVYEHHLEKNLRNFHQLKFMNSPSGYQMTSPTAGLASSSASSSSGQHMSDIFPSSPIHILQLATQLTIC
jgi:hypothetical protein